LENIIEFPGLGLSFELNRVAFTLFGQPIFWYGIIVGIGFAVGAYLVTKRARRFGLDPDRVIDAIIAATVLGIVGARTYYVIFRWEMYAGNFASIINLREGGLAFYGGVIGGALGALIVCKWRKIKPLPLIDLLASVVLISLAIGRWGNFVNVEAFGSNTTAPWGMTGTAIVNHLTFHQSRLAGLGIEVLPCTPVHPTFLYESLWNILGFIIIAIYIKRRRFDGEITLIFLGWYGLGRAFIEGLRIDSLMLGGLRVSQGVAILCFVVAAITLERVRSKIRKSDDPGYLALYVNTVGQEQDEQPPEEGDAGDTEQSEQPADETEQPTEEAEPHSEAESPPEGEPELTEEAKRPQGESDAPDQPDGEKDGES